MSGPSRTELRPWLQGPGSSGYGGGRGLVNRGGRRPPRGGTWKEFQGQVCLLEVLSDHSWKCRLAGGGRRDGERIQKDQRQRLLRGFGKRGVRASLTSKEQGGAEARGVPVVAERRRRPGGTTELGHLSDPGGRGGGQSAVPGSGRSPPPPVRSAPPSSASNEQRRQPRSRKTAAFLLLLFSKTWR